MEIKIQFPEAELMELIRTTLRDELAQLQPGNTTSGTDAPISIEEAATFTGFAKSTIYSLVSSNSIPNYKKNGRLFFFRSELKDWIREGEEHKPGQALHVAESRLSEGRKKRRA
jgi:excisionase family DNA binding protein